MKNYLNATPEDGKRFYQDFNKKGKVVMLNLLKFRSLADYEKSSELKPAKRITGKQAYELYMDNILKVLNKVGSSIVFYGTSKDFLIGPEFEKWDAVLLVEHQSVTKFMELAQSKDYLNSEGHRVAALKDSRLLPIIENSETLKTS